MNSTEARDPVAEAEPPRPSGTPGAPARRESLGGHAAGSRPRRRLWLAAGVVIVLAGTGAVLGTGALPTHGPSGSGSETYRTSTQPVTRQSLTEQTQVNGTLQDAGSWTVLVPPSASSSGSSSGGSSSGPASQTFTWLPAPGQTVRQGQAIYDVSGSPVVLLYGQVPAYRTLSEGMTGADVTQLNHDLVALGYASSAGIAALGWDYYSWHTQSAVTQLQSALGITSPTGTLALGSAVFLPGPALITGLGSSAVLGGPAGPGTTLATASSTTPVVSIDLDASLQSDVKDGDTVSITLPDGTTTQGTISQIATVASSSSGSNSSGNSGNSNSGSSASSPGTATITVLASLNNPAAAGSLNQAPVTVTITTGSAPDVLVVPVDALLAQSSGGYAVEVTSPHGRHLVIVRPGLFDDAAGLVQVTGDLTQGQRVVVPGS
jgi:hypothetical protein